MQPDQPQPDSCPSATPCNNPRHLFSFTPIRNPIHPPTLISSHLQVTISYCPSKILPQPSQHSQPTPSPSITHTSPTSFFPIFNTDQKYYTPAFILPTEKSEILQSDKEYLQSHNEKLNDYLHFKTKLYFPKPKSKRHHCGVCKHQYEDYMDHILSDKHKENLRRSKFSLHIGELCEMYKGEEKKEGEKGLNNEEGESIGLKPVLNKAETSSSTFSYQEFRKNKMETKEDARTKYEDEKVSRNYIQEMKKLYRKMVGKKRGEEHKEKGEAVEKKKTAGGNSR